jgi:undecaprenyl-phosphate galactose phosphotransferase
MLSPIFFLIAWAIKKDSKGPIFYKTDVVGKSGKTFKAYKFRSMISANSNNPEEAKEYREGNIKHIKFMREFIQGKVKGSFFVEDESRITKVGKILRKYSLDELPQLINILRGEMSLVGPRFSSVTEYSFYKPWQKRRFQVKPGMTGLWQVRARSEVTYDDMVMMDFYYIQNWSILFDIEILLRTIPVVLSGKGSRVK